MRPRRRLLGALLLALVVLAGVRYAISGASSGSPEASLATVLARDGLRVDPDTVLWLAEDDGPWALRPALFLAHAEGELDDVWYAEVRPGRGGAVLDVTSVANLTKSASSAEERLSRAGDHAVFLSRTGDQIDALTVLDLRGEDPEATASFTAVQRVQHAISNLQETGRTAGFGRVRYQRHETGSDADLRADATHVALIEGEHTVMELELATLALREGAERVDVQEHVPGQPGGITWVVDTVRNLSFVGPEPIEWLENRVFAVQDWWDRTRYALLGGEDTQEAVAAELGVTREDVQAQMSEERRALLTAAEAELGWPPPAMQPVITDDPVAGEGEWIPVIDDPFVNQYPGAPPAFVQGFVRPDVERPYVRVYVTMWDPRQVQLRVVPGTREPQSATGEVGQGRIPRDERTVRTLVAAFNGGFQAMHGEFGMMAERRVYLPPKPWAATVAVFDDGTVGMGSWPAPSWRGQYFDENLANRQIPEGMIEMRQNLTTMVEDGVWNPWERWWWGAAPQESEEQTFTYRSGLCLTQEGFLAFFWGSSLGPEALGQAMVSARCARAMHLDMNSGHCGFEFFRPYRQGATGDDAPPPVQRVHAEYEHDGELPQSPGWRVRGRKAVRSMAMRFPRYLARDPRDFFYLTLRPTLPGPALAGATESEGRFSSTGLPHAGWPYAFARTRSAETWIVRIDPRRAVPAPLHRAVGEDAPRLLGGFTGASSGAISLYATRASIGHEIAIGRAGPDDLVLLSGAPLADGAAAAVGVDRDGFLVYAEGGDVRAALTRAGVTDAIALGDDVRLALAGEGGAAAPDGETARDLSAEPALALYAAQRAAAEVIFPDNAPMPYSRWGYLQGQRVRYFPDHPPRFSREAEGEETSPQ
ncbi:hypothetical protein [Sandaracinus amylolyticus]|uniref:Uncharacterized protein n=1 Tax=Sandaracinus amylolyticus TaxID=927083 RepID=A0A0F6W422_9BACT|nr:hypothetical protein [Sandaracinus amylolyticus]AKF06873.1 hypothetical protein DB32_004022 [Sandaracinus amylolyticus]